jgi:DNA polymerase-3 subunit delta'
VSVEPPLPRANPELVGQEAAERALLTCWSSGRVPHAWLFTGPRGVGKATLAYRFARFALAGGGAAGGALFGAAAPPASLAMAPTDPTFKLVAACGHPDLFVLERGMINPESSEKKPSEEILIYWVRQHIAALHLTPSREGGFRILLVDEAERMNRNSENALLKILEEPLKNTLLLLVSHAPGRLLPTIRSRCRLLPMPALEPATVARLLAPWAEALTPAERDAVAALADGSIGRALELVRFDGLGLHRELVALSATLPRVDSGRLAALAERVGAAGPDAQAEFRMLMELIDAWTARLAKAAVGGPAGELVPGDGEVLRRVAALGAGHWLDAWSRARRLAAATDGLNLDRRQAATNALLALAEPPCAA